MLVIILLNTSHVCPQVKCCKSWKGSFFYADVSVGKGGNGGGGGGRGVHGAVKQ